MDNKERSLEERISLLEERLDAMSTNLREHLMWTTPCSPPSTYPKSNDLNIDFNKEQLERLSKLIGPSGIKAINGIHGIKGIDD